MIQNSGGDIIHKHSKYLRVHHDTFNHTWVSDPIDATLWPPGVPIPEKWLVMGDLVEVRLTVFPDRIIPTKPSPKRA